MNHIQTEKAYQAELLNILEKQNGYLIRKASNFDRYFAIDREIYKERLEETLIAFINAECTKKSGSLLEVLKHGVELSGHHLNLMYTKPATAFNPDLMAKYKKNRFSVMEEVWINDTQRVDVVIFLNGFAIIALELKCNFSGQSIEDAIYQYRNDRDPNARLFFLRLVFW